MLLNRCCKTGLLRRNTRIHRLYHKSILSTIQLQAVYKLRMKYIYTDFQLPFKNDTVVLHERITTTIIKRAPTVVPPGLSGAHFEAVPI